jgi:diadenosine tetraphosphatase ApaH/serine/threonine PP2A family protein phosphatase
MSRAPAEGARFFFAPARVRGRRARGGGQRYDGGVPSNFPAVRVALLSDIHANREALEACLAHARAQKADRHVYLGDIVGYGADASAVVARIADDVAQGALAVRGNHDDALERPAGYFNHEAQAALEHARRVLSPEHRQFLSSLPLMVRDGALCFVHASADRPERWEYIDSARAAERCVAAADSPFTFCGHVHVQRLYFETRAGRMSEFEPRPGAAIPMPSTRRWLAIVGSVGQPRDGRTAAQYALFDTERGEITFHRVPYDARAAAARIREAGLPEALAYRVEAGI